MNTKAQSFVEEIEVRGHIIDSLILPRILDSITSVGASFDIKEISIGHGKHDPSHAIVKVIANSQEQLDEILAHANDHGAVPTANDDCRLVEADIVGAFPEEFYATTNQVTQVRFGGEWIDVEQQEMDCGIVVDQHAKTARCVPMLDIQPGMQVVVSHRGIRVFPHEKAREQNSFEFMNSSVSTEKPKGIATRAVAAEFFEAKRSGKKTAIVGGPAIVHTGSVDHLSWLIREGYVNVLLAGNALAAHDLERAMFGTSLGVCLTEGNTVEAGHEHHLRAINRVRRAGSIKAAVEQGMVKRGVMYECVKNDVSMLLAGSIRDDGPLPEVVTDVISAQKQMRELVKGVDFCLMIATTLHSVAVGNLLPASVKVVCVDINPSTVIKLSDRGSFQTQGIVTDVEPFLRTLVSEIQALEGNAS